MINLQTKFEVYMFIPYKDMENSTKGIIWGDLRG